ncbi:MAG TPA: phosphoribosyltransferase family protein [Candidatus Methylomirabilis sp.]|nr:phosphoribosyltransferase family protein [Candidatus Methylomirabilis sp.]
MRFHDRGDAGQQLAVRLSEEFKGRDDVSLFALPRGGAVLGAEVAKTLGMPFDLIVTRKIGAPDNEEYALGALAETGEVTWNNPVERDAYPKKKLDAIITDETDEAKRRIAVYRGGRVLPDLEGKTAIIVDDGIATGATMKAAVLAAKHQHAKRIVVAVPHGAKDTIASLRQDGNEVVALAEPDWYGAVGSFYDEFEQVEDEEVLGLMKEYGMK